MAGSSSCVFCSLFVCGFGVCVWGLLFPSTDEHKKGYHHVFAPQLCCIHGFSGGHTHTQKRGHGRGKKTNDSPPPFSVSFAPAPYSEKRGVRQRGRLHQRREGATLDIALLLLYCRPRGEMVCGKVLSLPLLQMMRKRNPAQRKEEEEESVLITGRHLLFFFAT